jgi:hypothetical protein
MFACQVPAGLFSGLLSQLVQIVSGFPSQKMALKNQFSGYLAAQYVTYFLIWKLSKD